MLNRSHSGCALALLALLATACTPPQEGARLGSAAATRAAAAAPAPFVRISAEHRLPAAAPDTGLLLMPGETFRRFRFSNENAPEFRDRVAIHLFEGHAFVPRDRTHETAYAGRRRRDGGFLNAVTETRRRAIEQTHCEYRSSRDIVGEAGRLEELTDRYLLGTFRDYQVDPATYPDVEARTEPRDNSSQVISGHDPCALEWDLSRSSGAGNWR